MPTVRRLRTGRTLRRSARIPQCASRMFVRYSDVEEAGEERVADAAQPGHRAGLDTVHAIPDDELRAVVELVDEARNLAEVVGEVGVDHDDVVAARSRQSGQIRAPVAAPRLVDDQRAGGARELAAAVRRAVVDDDHLAREAVLLEHGPRARDALGDRLRLVEAGDDDGHTTRRRRFWGDGHSHFSLGGYGACASASSTTACTRTRSAEPSAGTETSPSGWPPAGHDVTYLTLRQWERGDEAGRSGRPRRRRRPEDRALHTRAGDDACCLRSSSASECSSISSATADGTTSSTRRRSRTSRFSPWASPRRRGRFRIIVDWHEVWTRELLARVPRAVRRQDRLVGAARLSARAPAGVLLLEAARASPARARAPRRADASSRGSTRSSSSRRRPQPRAAGRRLRGSLHPREARPGSRAGSRARAGADSRSARRDLRRRPRAREGTASDRRARARRLRLRARVRRPQRCSSRLSRARSASCSRPGGRATVASSSKPPRAACPRSSSRGRTTRPPSSSRRA